MAREAGLSRTPESQSLVQSDQRPTYTPPCDVFENQDEILLVADLPGVTPDALTINLDQGELTVHARREAKQSPGNVSVMEYREGDFHRRFAVPRGIDGNKIQAQLKNGTLTLHLPKSDELKPREIKVRAG